MVIYFLQMGNHKLLNPTTDRSVNGPYPTITAEYVSDKFRLHRWPRSSDLYKELRGTFDSYQTVFVVTVSSLYFFT